MIATTNAEFKSYRLPLRVRNIERVVWFCVGVGAELRRLLRDVRLLGKKTSQGYGVARAWEVDSAEEDWSWFSPSDAGKLLMRPLPMSCADAIGAVGGRRFYGGIVPPYWDAEYFAEGLSPC